MRKTVYMHLCLLLAATLAVVSCADDKISDRFTSTELRELEFSQKELNSDVFFENELTCYVRSTGTTWKFEDVPTWLTVTPSIGTESKEVKIKFNHNSEKERTATIYLLSADPSWPARIPIKVSQVQNQKYAIKAMDLGLSVKWADMNLAATSTTDPGHAFAWGETKPKASYTWSNYKYGSSSYNLKKYCVEPEYGTVDNDSVLNAEDDAATVNLGEDWRMPTLEEFVELITYTRSERTGSNLRIYSLKEGYTDKYIDIPLSRYYKNNTEYDYNGANSSVLWSSSTGVDCEGKACVYSYSDGKEFDYPVMDRYLGLRIRPVTDLKESDITEFTISRNQATMAPNEVSGLSSKVMVGERTTDLFTVVWTSDNPNVVSVNQNGVITAIAAGSATITASIGELKAECSIIVKNPVPEYVDLGLSVRWATFNVGAAAPEGTGYYFAWGETEPKQTYTWENYKYKEKNSDNLTKYNEYSVLGPVDYLNVLQPEDDAATAQWGEGWITPTSSMYAELIDNCNWEMITINGVTGYKVTGTAQGFESNSIFLPLWGYRYENNFYGIGIDGRLWTSTLRPSDSYSSYYLYFNSSTMGPTYYRYREYGQPVRAVRPFSVNDATDVTIEGESVYTLGVGASLKLNGTVKMNGRVLSVTPEWTSSDPSVATVSQDGLVSTLGSGSCVIQVQAGNASASCVILVFDAVPEYVDLGLSVLWAKFNLGSLSPTDIGGYYAWGETQPKGFYGWSTYKWGNTDISLTKYVCDPDQGLNGHVDSLTVLEPEDDAAHVLWGNGWRIPEGREWEELINKDNCTWEWTEDYNSTGVTGYKVTSKVAGYENEYIFLPCQGFAVEDQVITAQGRYRSSTLGSPNNTLAEYAYLNDGAEMIYRTSRYYGYTVRPVKKIDAGFFASLGFKDVNDTLRINVNGNYQLELIGTTPNNKTRQLTATEWKSDNTVVASVSENGFVIGLKPGIAIITAVYEDREIKCVVEVPDPYQYVDMGLSVYWATMDIGEEGFMYNPDNYLSSYYVAGHKYAWGETEYKYGNYDWSNYNWAYNSHYSLTKYCTSTTYGYNGFTDNKTVLDPEDDVAHVRMGGNWRMPTEIELLELVQNSTVNYDANMYGVFAEGFTFYSKINNKTLVFTPQGEPSTGIWSSVLANDDSYVKKYYNYTAAPYMAYMLVIDKSEVYGIAAVSRMLGHTVRAVRTSDTWKGITTFTLDSDHLELTEGYNSTLNTTIMSGDLSYSYPVMWESTDPSVATVDGRGKVTAIKEGTATIKATCHDKVATCSVTVQIQL